MTYFNFKESVKHKYPDLYWHFLKLEYWEFMTMIGLSMKAPLAYHEVWDYIKENETLHDLWFL